MKTADVAGFLWCWESRVSQCKSIPEPCLFDVIWGI